MSEKKTIESYGFPSDLQVKLIKQDIEFTLPNKLIDDFKEKLFEQEFYKKFCNGLRINQDPKNERKYIIKGKNDLSAKIKILLYIFENQKNKGEPLYIVPQQQLTTEEVYLLISHLNPSQLQNIEGLIEDENHDPQEFKLKIGDEVNAQIQYIEFDKYKITFLNNAQNGKDICKQVADELQKIKSKDCVLAKFSKADSFDITTLRQQLNIENAEIVVIPDEKTMNDEFATTYVEVIVPELNDTLFEQIKTSLEKFYETVKLVFCSKCHFYFCPSQNETCFKYFHKGKQIPFDSGQLEEIDEDEEEEPIILVNYTCCGECIKDEPPINCGKEPQGKHEEDPNEKPPSELKIERSHPGNIKFTN